MRQLGNGLAFLYHGLTLGAHQIAGVALLGAGGIFLVLQLGLVLGQGQLGLFLADLGLGLSVGEVLVALGAVPVVNVALYGTGGVFLGHCGEVVNVLGELIGLFQGEIVILGVFSSGAASGSIHRNGFVVEQIFAQVGDRSGDKNVLQLGVVFEHTLDKRGDGVRDLKCGVCLSGGINQQLGDTVVVEHAVHRGVIGIGGVHPELFQIGILQEGIVHVVNVFQAGGEGDAFNGAGLGQVGHIIVQSGDG